MPEWISILYHLYWMSSFLGLSGGIFRVYSNCDRTLCMQTLDTLIRRRILRRLIWVCTVCLCPIKRTLGLCGYFVLMCFQSRSDPCFSFI